MQLTNNTFLNSLGDFNTASSFRKSAIERISTGTKLNRSGVDAGALSASLRLKSKQAELSNKSTNIQNSLSYLQSQEAAVGSAMKIMSRISELKILASAPTVNGVDKTSYNKEFIELSDQLNSLKQQSFNKISLFSEIQTGAGLNTGSTESLSSSTQSNGTMSISRHVLDIEDLRFITEAGDAAKRGFGGIDVTYFPETESQPQIETISIGGNIAKGDEFRIMIRELSALLETESDTDFYHLAESDDEDSESVRDSLYDQIVSNPIIMNFLDVAKTGTGSFSFTAKMDGDPYLVHIFESSGTTGSIATSTVSAGSQNDAQEDTLQINLGNASLQAGDQVSLIVNGQTISYTATASDEANDKDPSKGASWGERYLANQITNQINANGSINGDLKAISNREMVGNSLRYKAGSVLIHSKVRGTSFNSNSQSLTMNSLNQATKSITLSTTSPNATGTNKEISVRIGADDTTPGGGTIADGDVYRLSIRETHSDEQSNQYNSWFNAKTQNYFVTTTSGMSNDDIRTNFLSQINARADSRNGSYSAVAGGTGELIISERNAGDSFSVSSSVSTRDFLRKTQDQANVSPFSIEHSMNYLTEMLSQNGAEQSRLKLDLGNVQNHYTVGEQAMSRITDSDFAHEATQLAAASLKSQMASKVIANSSRLKDVLIPLTTEHFRSKVLSSTL